MILFFDKFLNLNSFFSIVCTEEPDYPDGSFGLDFVDGKIYLATADGILEETFIVGQWASNTSSNPTTPFSAVQITRSVGDYYYIETAQLPGDTVNYSLFAPNSTESVTFDISILPISGYVPLDQIEQLQFPASQTVTLAPGSSLNIDTNSGLINTPTVSEPSFTVLVSLSAISLGALVKKLKRN